MSTLALCILAILAINASAASAAGKWYTGATATTQKELVGSAGVNAALAPFTFGSGSLNGQTATALTIQWNYFGQHIELKANEAEFLESTIQNGPSGKGQGRVRLKGVSLTQPSCTVTGEQITTNSLNWELISAGGTNYVRFSSPTGELFSFGLPNCGGITARWSARGSFAFAAADISTGLVSHKLTTNKAAQEAAGASLQVMGSYGAYVEGALSTTLNGAYAGQFWSLK